MRETESYQIEKEYLEKLLEKLDEKSNGKIEKDYWGYYIRCFSTKKQVYWFKIFVCSNTYGHHPMFQECPRPYYVHKKYYKERPIEELDDYYPYSSCNIREIIEYID